METRKSAASESQLLHDLFQSSEEAMAELAERYTSSVRNTAEGYLRDPEDVKECVNDTFMEFFRNRDCFDSGKGSLNSYLSGIAKNLAVSRFRKNAAPPAAELRSDVADRSDPIEAAEHRMDLEQAIDHLST